MGRGREALRCNGGLIERPMTQTRQAAQPALYRLAEDGRRLQIRLLADRAGEDLTFPFNAYGTARSGRPPAECVERLTDGRAVLKNFVTVHGEIVPGLKPPFIVGEVELAPGIVEEAIIEAASETELHIGMTLQAMAFDDPANAERFVCRFVPVSASGEAP